MKCEDLSLVSKKERESKEIAPISTTFYQDAKKYLHELEEYLEELKDPRSAEYRMMSDEINTSRGRIEEIFHLRRNKIYLMAAQASNLPNIQHKNYSRLLPEEKCLYDSLIQPGEILKKILLDPVLYPEEETGLEEEKEDCVLVQILQDIAPFTGTDGQIYTVKTEDKLRLPVSNAQGLIKRNAAKLISN